MTTSIDVSKERAVQPNEPVRAVMIGCGKRVQYFLKNILAETDHIHVPVVCEPSAAAYAATVELFAEAGRRVPGNQPDLTQLLVEYADSLDVAIIGTPHVHHHVQARACLVAGLDVMLEKPMVMNEAEARSLIEATRQTGRLLVVAFNGSLSPQIRTAAALLRSGELGPIRAIHGVIWQHWDELTTGTWRQVPAISGGGFLFDTGAHMLNTVADLAGEEFVEVTAVLDNRDTPVEINGAVIARLASGAIVTLAGCGEAIPSCASDVKIFCDKGIVRTCAWGRRLEIQWHGSDTFEPVEVPTSLGVWDQFLAVRAGRLSNPCPPEVGLRMLRLWNAMQASAAQGGVPVRIEATGVERDGTATSGNGLERISSRADG